MDHRKGRSLHLTCWGKKKKRSMVPARYPAGLGRRLFVDLLIHAFLFVSFWFIVVVVVVGPFCWGGMFVCCAIHQSY